MVWDDHYGSPNGDFSASDLKIIVDSLEGCIQIKYRGKDRKDLLKEEKALKKEVFKVLRLARALAEELEEYEDERD